MKTILLRKRKDEVGKDNYKHSYFSLKTGKFEDFPLDETPLFYVANSAIGYLGMLDLVKFFSESDPIDQDTYFYDLFLVTHDYEDYDDSIPTRPILNPYIMYCVYRLNHKETTPLSLLDIDFNSLLTYGVPYIAAVEMIKEKYKDVEPKDIEILNIDFSFGSPQDFTKAMKKAIMSLKYLDKEETKDEKKD